MNKTKFNKKRIIIIAITAMLLLVACVGIGAFVWYNNSPFPTARKMMSAWKEKDIDTMLECIEPKTSQRIRSFMSLTGVPAESLMDIFLSPKSDKENTNRNARPNHSSVQLDGYERNGNNACVSFTTISGERMIKCEINFVRISGIWYLSLDHNLG